ncbi:MAG: hypothetical protein U9R36_03940 [Elusimicrobiota bacterium]|nr:hypothetical protein [Elusimicrobiota bacterium]
MMKILLNRNFIFTISLVIGLAAGGRMEVFTFIRLSVLMLIMTFVTLLYLIFAEKLTSGVKDSSI